MNLDCISVGAVPARVLRSLCSTADVFEVMAGKFALTSLLLVLVVAHVSADRMLLQGKLLLPQLGILRSRASPVDRLEDLLSNIVLQ